MSSQPIKVALLVDRLVFYSLLFDLCEYLVLYLAKKGNLLCWIACS